MSNPGGYQLINCEGVELNAEAAVSIINDSMADILRSSNKRVEMYNITLGATTINVTAVLRTDTGATDGKVYYFIAPDSAVYAVSTDDATVTFTPV